MEVTITGFGLAGACLALVLQDRGFFVRVMEDGRGGSTVVAAGLVNPLAGKNFEPGWRWADFWPTAERFYDQLQPGLFQALPIERLMTSEKDWKKYRSKEEQLVPWQSEVRKSSVVFQGGGWLDTRRFLAAAKARFLEKGGDWRSSALNEGDAGVEVDCRGAVGLRDIDAWSGPQRCAKGEILTLRAPELTPDRIRTGRGWILPIGGGLFRAGATYDWDGLDRGPTPEGRAQVCEMVEAFAPGPFEVVAHHAGVRPIVRRSQPVLCEKAEGEWVFNGLGSKGVIYAPRTAIALADHLEGQGSLDPDLEFRIG